MTNPGRNDPCPCGSGKRFKQCCGIFSAQTGAIQSEPARQETSADRGQYSYVSLAMQPHLAERLETHGHIDQTIVRYEHALASKPDRAESHNDLGVALWAKGNLEQAAAHFERALVLKPDYIAAHINLGLTLAARGRMELATVHYQRALTLEPDNIEAHYNLGNALHALGKPNTAMTHLERVLSLKPDHAEAHNNLGVALFAKGKLEQAAAHFERALALRPEDALAHNNLGNTLTAQGKVNQACARYARALALKPDYVETDSNLLLALNYISDIDPGALFRAHVDYAKRREVSLARTIQTHANDRSRERRIRVAYVSSDFRQHSVAHFIEPVLKHHHREQFEVFCYFNHSQADALTKRIQMHADHWRSLFSLSDEQAAQQIRADRIDILIDLNGHTELNRLLVFARKPAPIQVTWLGYPNTTGLSTMDYRLTDEYADPVGMSEHFHTEQLLRLPKCFSCYRAPDDAPEVMVLPARARGCITFGSFNNLAKITPEVILVWARILQAIPGSRLCLKNRYLGDDAVQQSVREAFVKSGAAPEQLEFLGYDHSSRDHFEQYNRIDIGLDSFPYNGSTTTCEALWMGVPVVTLAGRAHAGRVGVSLLSNLALTKLIANTTDEYIATALRLAADLEGLDALRKELRSRMASSPLMDGRGFTKNLEQVYRVIWQNWCLKGMPNTFHHDR